MKKKSFTPGPWVAKRHDEEWEVIKADYAGLGRIVICRDIEQGDDYGEADARLIAAAPELLDALASLYSRFRNDGLGKDKWYGPTMKLAKAAITKATGEKEESI